MAGDLRITERAALETAARVAEPVPGWPGRVIHQYGRLTILAIPKEREDVAARALEADLSPRSLTELEQLGLAALRLRESSQYRSAKENRPRAGELWDMRNCTKVVAVPALSAARAALAPAPPTSAYLEGTVAVGIVIVQGPTADLKF